MENMNLPYLAQTIEIRYNNELYGTVECILGEEQNGKQTIEQIIKMNNYSQSPEYIAVMISQYNLDLDKLDPNIKAVFLASLRQSTIRLLDKLEEVKHKSSNELANAEWKIENLTANQNKYIETIDRLKNFIARNIKKEQIVDMLVNILIDEDYDPNDEEDGEYE